MSTMKQAVRTDLWLDAAFDARLAPEGSIAIRMNGREKVNWATYQRTHVSITSRG